MLKEFEANLKIEYEDVDSASRREWLNENWHLCFYYVSAYVIVIFGGQLYMQNRPRFELRTLLFLWNVFLAVFSIWGTQQTLPELLYVLNNFGFHYSACITGKSFLEADCLFGKWMSVFSKYLEIGDTLFLVLKKQKIIFLHWYHHATVILYGTYSYPQYIPASRWYIGLNYLVHSAMYSYFALKTLRIRAPRVLAMSITVVQILQMVIGVLVTVYTYYIKETGGQCEVSYKSINASFLMYLTYFVLFINFFCSVYLKNNLGAKMKGIFYLSKKEK